MIKKVFFDIGHPAHVHYFKNTINFLKSKDIEIFLTARNRYPVFELLKSEKIDYYDRGQGRDSRLGKLSYMLEADYKLLSIAKTFNPDLFVSFGAIYATHVAKLLSKPSIFLDDTDSNVLNRKFALPFATNIFSPSVFSFNLGEKHIKFDSYMELAYLHPRVFNPSRKLVESLGISTAAVYTVIRFVDWKASHDFNHSGITQDNKIKAVKEFSQYGKVLISSESKLPPQIAKYATAFPPEYMHHVMSFANLVYGESATMASEAAVLGVPSIYLDNDGRSYTDEEEERYNLVSNFTESLSDQEKSIVRGKEILGKGKSTYFMEQREKILMEKISLSDYFNWLIINYPNSISTLQTDESFQDCFIYP